MSNCGQACPYNTLDGCKVKEYNKICPLTNTATPITEYRKTNADHFREAISDEDGLAKFLMKVNDDGIYIPFCQNKEECWELIEENGVPEEKCMECMKLWLRKPYEGDCV